MLSMFLALALASSPETQPTDPEPQAVLACATEAFRPLVSPRGIATDWPLASALPAALEDQAGHRISDAGDVYDGYSHYVLHDDTESVLYVVQRGGFAGGQTAYGPLAIPSCDSP